MARLSKSATWSLLTALAWITHRSAEDLDDRGHWSFAPEAIDRLTDALRSGRLPARGLFEGESGFPRAIDKEEWATLTIRISRKMFTGYFFAGGPPMPVLKVVSTVRPRSAAGVPIARVPEVDGVTVPAATVRKVWPSVKIRTSKAETECRKWLAEQMRKSPAQQPKTKSSYRKQQPSLGDRAFNRAWKGALAEVKPKGWGKAGRPQKSSH